MIAPLTLAILCALLSVADAILQVKNGALLDSNTHLLPGDPPPPPLTFSSFMDLRRMELATTMEGTSLLEEEPSGAIVRTSFLKNSSEKDILESWLGPAPKTPLHADVPNKVHMIYVSDRSPEWLLYYYLHVHAALVTQKPEAFYIYYDTEPHGEYWQRTIKLPKVQRVQVDGSLYKTFLGHPVHVGAHQADKLRLMTLLRHGGVYLDTDVLSLGSFSPLRKADSLNSACAFLGKEPGGFGNSVIGAVPNCPFLRLWWQNYTDFNDAQWKEHSILRPGRIQKDHPKLLEVLPMGVFTPYWPHFSGPKRKTGLFEVMSTRMLDMPGIDSVLTGTPPQLYNSSLVLPLSIHLFSHRHGKELANVTDASRCSEDTLYNKLTRLSLPCS